MDKPADDLCRRAPFAAGIAKAIKVLPKGRCFVIAIHGPWGDGKTIVLRFDFVVGEPVEVAEFNPWRLARSRRRLSIGLRVRRKRGRRPDTALIKATSDIANRHRERRTGTQVNGGSHCG